MKKLLIALSAFFIALMVFSACAAPPTEEMQRARDAVMRAESDADAVAYAGNTLIRARDALTRMESEAEAKRYDSAKNYAAEAISNAEKAIADGKTGAVRNLDEAANLINSLSGPLAETSSALDAAMAAGDILADFDSLSDDMDAARRVYDEAWQSFNDDNYKDALGKGQTVRSLISGINAEINEAARASSRKQ